MREGEQMLYERDALYGSLVDSGLPGVAEKSLPHGKGKGLLSLNLPPTPTFSARRWLPAPALPQQRAADWLPALRQRLAAHACCRRGQLLPSSARRLSRLCLYADAPRAIALCARFMCALCWRCCCSL